MSRLIAIVMAAGVLLLQGCTTHCRGDSCSRPASSASALVVWWPPAMRVETGPDAMQPDHQIVPIEQ